MKIKKISIGIMMLFSAFASAQQEPNVVLTGAPFLKVTLDARGGALGDMGAAASPDAFSQYWNRAKYAYSKRYSGVALSYARYMSSITDDVFILNDSY